MPLLESNPTAIFAMPRTPDCTLSFGVRVFSPEHYDLSLVQHFLNVLWHRYVDQNFLGVYTKALLQVSNIPFL